jgi:hypothetical protein
MDFLFIRTKTPFQGNQPHDYGYNEIRDNGDITDNKENLIASLPLFPKQENLSVGNARDVDGSDNHRMTVVGNRFCDFCRRCRRQPNDCLLTGRRNVGFNFPARRKPAWDVRSLLLAID